MINLETTATLKPDGSFCLHTPHKGAAKSVSWSYSIALPFLTFETRFMPPSIPCGTPSDGIVFARLLVDGEDRGVKPFLVPIHDGYSMSPGITAKFVLARINPPRLLTPILSFAIDSYPLAVHPSPSITPSPTSTTSDFHPQRCLPRHIARRIPEPNSSIQSRG